MDVDHVTIYRWVQRFTPEFVEAARTCRHVPGDRWFVDETYVKVNGRWTYLYRAIDQFGQVIDVWLSTTRDLTAARLFFTRALATGVVPVEVTTDRAPAYPRILDEVMPAALHDTEQYANNRVEADPQSYQEPPQSLIRFVSIMNNARKRHAIRVRPSHGVGEGEPPQAGEGVTTLTVDDLQVEVRDSERRAMLQITIDRGGELIVFAPVGCDSTIVEDFVREKRPWIYKKLAEKEALRQPTSPKSYVTGEGFPYLGRSHRLLVVDDQNASVKLEAGRFKMLRSATENGRDHMVAWYTAHAQPWLAERVERLAGRVGHAPAGVVVRDLGYRWGSCGKDGTVYFHRKCVLLPPRIVE